MSREFARSGSNGLWSRTAHGLRCLALIPLLAAVGANAGTTELLSEDFHDFTANNSADVSASLDGYTAVAGWSGSKVYCYSGRAKLGSSSATGWIATPPLDLSGNGIIRLSCTIEQYSSDVNTVDIDIGAEGSAYTTLLTVTPTTNLVLDITNGTAASRIRFQTSAKRCYLDNLTVVRITDDTPTPPVWTPGDWTNVAATAGTAVSVELLPHLSGNPAPELTLASGSGAVSSGAWTFTPAAAGSYTAVIDASNASGIATVALAVTAVEPPPETAGELTFLTSAASVTESSGTLVAIVSREGGAAGAVTVAYATADGTALAGSDYTAVSGVLSFPAGATSRSISVPILNDSVIEANETFSILLSSPTGGAVLGSNTVLAVTITDDDAPAPVDPNASYYASCYNADGTVKTGAALKSALCAILNANVRTNSYSSTLNDDLDVIDADPDNPSKVLCLYSQTAISRSSYNKEHIWAQSHGIDERAPAYSDLHHIRACTPTLNSSRGDRDFDDCRDVAGAKETSGNYYTSTAWEPQDAAKGDVARAMFYMDVRYEGRYNGNNDLTLVENIPTSSSGNDLGRLSTLLAWNELDPVSPFETNRNERIYRDYQKNRNPFIDHPEWVTAIYDPEHFIQSTNTYVLTVDCGTNGYVDPMTASVAAGTSQTFAIVPERYYYISSIYQGSEQIAPYLYANRSYYAHTWSVVTSDGVLAVRFSPQLAALGTPIYWLAELGYTDNFDAAELDDLNDDGIPLWQEYLSGADPLAEVLPAPANLRVTATNATSFSVAWSAVAGVTAYVANAYAVLVTEPSTLISESFENSIPSGWIANSVTVSSRTGMDGSRALLFNAANDSIVTPALAHPDSISFQYVRSSGTTVWPLAVQTSSSADGPWTTLVTVTNASTAVKTTNIDLTAFSSQTIYVRLLDQRTSGTSSRYVDLVTVTSAGSSVTNPVAGWAGREIAATTCTVGGLSPETEYFFTVAALAPGSSSLVSAPVPVTTLVAPPVPVLTPYQTWLESIGISSDAPAYAESSASTDDPDGDGVPNYAEYLADTDPADPGAFFAIVAATMSNGTLSLTPTPISTGRVYQVVYRTNLLAAPMTNELGGGVTGLQVLTNVPGTWFGTIRVSLPAD